MSNLSNTDWDSAVTDAGAVVEIAKLHIDTEDAKGNLTGTYDVYNISNGTNGLGDLVRRQQKAKS